MTTDWLPELADDDLDTLIEALEAWESKDIAGDMMVTLFDSVLTQKHGEMPPQVAKERYTENLRREAAKKLRKERSVMLRAKLLTIRDRRRAQRMTDDALRMQR